MWLLAALAAAVLCALAWVLRPVPLTGLLGAEPERVGLTLDWGDENGLRSHPLDQETQDELYRLLSGCPGGESTPISSMWRANPSSP